MSIGNSQESPQSPEPKRRKLDELFADEPFLSPTMKARRLHEKLTQQTQQSEGSNADRAAQGLPTEAYVRSITEKLSSGGAAHAGDATQMDEQADTAVRPVSLVDAAIFLRSKGAQVPRSVGVPARARLLDFRDHSLNTWINAIEER